MAAKDGVSSLVEALNSLRSSWGPCAAGTLAETDPLP